MFTSTRALSVKHALNYHRRDYTLAAENRLYYAKSALVEGHFEGKLAAKLGLQGAVDRATYERLVLGQHPLTGEQLIGHRNTSRAANGKEISHRAGYDLTFAAPKSISIMAGPGGDKRIVEVHREAVSETLKVVEEFVQSHSSGDIPARTTGNLVASVFEHDVARPDDDKQGIHAPQPHLHSHCIVANMTDAGDTIRSLEARAFFKHQVYFTSVYQGYLARGLQQLGYKTVPGEGNSVEIAGISKAYRVAMSDRAEAIKREAQKQGLSGAEAMALLQKRTRNKKVDWEPEHLRAEHLKVSAKFGSPEPELLKQALRSQGFSMTPEQIRVHADKAIAHSRESLFERNSVVSEVEILQEALRHGRGTVTHSDVAKSLSRGVTKGQFNERTIRQNVPGKHYTIPELQDAEWRSIRIMHDGQGQSKAMAPGITEDQIIRKNAMLNPDQRRALQQIVTSNDNIFSVQGLAGTGKTTLLREVRRYAADADYEIQGLAPTSTARQNLADAGVKAKTLQKHLSRKEMDSGPRKLFVLDEASMVSTMQMSRLLAGLRAQDRLLLTGDRAQHKSVEAGSTFAQLQDFGMETIKLDAIIRQVEPTYLEIVNKLAAGNVYGAVADMEKQSRIHQEGISAKRYEAIAEDFAARPLGSTLVVSGTNQSRSELNQAIRTKLQQDGKIGRDTFTATILTARSELTAADRKRSEAYNVGDVIQFHKRHKTLGVRSGEYAKVLGVSGPTNEIVVRINSGRLIRYDPAKHSGVTVAVESQRTFASGERLMFTGIRKDLEISNRDFGTLEALDSRGNAGIRMDDGRTIQANLGELRNVDYGYVSTSYSSQSATFDSVIVNVATQSQTSNRELAYVSMSRGRHDLQLYTDDSTKLAASLSRETERPTAIEIQKPSLDYSWNDYAESLNQPSHSYGMGI